VLDAFHVVKLGNTVVDEVRRRVQQQTLGHRGFAGDPLFQVRRLLLRGREHLTDKATARLDAALEAGDPDWEVTVAGKQPNDCARSTTPSTWPRAGDKPNKLLEQLHTCPIPEVARLGRTLRSWRSEFLAYFDTDRVSNGPTEAMNLLIEKIRRVGFGFRNFDNYRLRVLLHWKTPLTPRIRTRHPRLVA